MNFLAMAANKLGERLKTKFMGQDGEGPSGGVLGSIMHPQGQADQSGYAQPSGGGGIIGGIGQLIHPATQMPQTSTAPDNISVTGGGALPMDINNASAAQEARARNSGFKSYQQMLDWAKQRNQQSGGTVPSGGAQPGSVAAGVHGAEMLYPRNMLNYVKDRWQQAVGEQGQ